MDPVKRDFILKRGVLGKGLPIGLLMSFVVGYQAPGQVMHFQAFNWKTFLIALAIYLPAFLAAGYVWGFWVYRRLYGK